MTDPNLPVGFSERELKEEYTEDELDKLELAEECGLTFTGRDDEGNLTWTGSDAAWHAFDDGGI